MFLDNYISMLIITAEYILLSDDAKNIVFEHAKRGVPILFLSGFRARKTNGNVTLSYTL